MKEETSCRFHERHLGVCNLLEIICKIVLASVLRVEIMQSFHQMFKAYVTLGKLGATQRKFKNKSTEDATVNVRRQSNISMEET